MCARAFTTVTGQSSATGAYRTLMSLAIIITPSRTLITIRSAYFDVSVVAGVIVIGVIVIGVIVIGVIVTGVIVAGVIVTGVIVAGIIIGS